MRYFEITHKYIIDLIQSDLRAKLIGSKNKTGHEIIDVRVLFDRDWGRSFSEDLMYIEILTKTAKGKTRKWERLYL